MKKTILYIFIFVIVGELMIRFDKKFTVLEINRIVKISTDIEITPEYQMLNNKNFVFNKEDLRIMVIGDSYIHGGGIDFNNNFSQQLKKILKTETSKYKNIWVLDVSKSSSNNFDNNQTYFQFADKFNPNIVIIGYNINDVSGNLNNKKVLTTVDNLNITKSSGGEAQSAIKKIYNIIYTSDFIQFVFHKIHNELKSVGVILPNSNFDYTMKSYYQEKDNWKKSKILLEEIISETEKRGTQLIIYKFPEINLLEHPELFYKANNVIADFFTKHNSLIYRDGGKCFIEKKSKDYILSKYDGHPNEKAHYIMANDVYEIIKREYTPHNKQYKKLGEKW